VHRPWSAPICHCKFASFLNTCLQLLRFWRVKSETTREVWRNGAGGVETATPENSGRRRRHRASVERLNERERNDNRRNKICAVPSLLCRRPGCSVVVVGPYASASPAVRRGELPTARRKTDGQLSVGNPDDVACSQWSPTWRLAASFRRAALGSNCATNRLSLRAVSARSRLQAVTRVQLTRWSSL